MTGWSVMLRGIRYRSGRSLVVLLIAAFATLAAVLIPAYGRAAASRCSPTGCGRPRSAAAGDDQRRRQRRGRGGWRRPAAGRRGQSAGRHRVPRAPNLAAVLDRPISSVETESQIALRRRRALRRAARVAVGSCGQLSINGTCAIDAEQVVISERSAKEAGIKLGDFVTVRAARGDGEGKRLRGRGPLHAARCHDIYWGNSAYFAHAGCRARVACRAWTPFSPARRTTSAWRRGRRDLGQADLSAQA